MRSWMPEFGQILFHHRPLIVTTALVTGYTSIVIAHVVVNCLYVATRVGNQDPPLVTHWTLSIIINSLDGEDVCIIQEVQQHDEVTVHARINVECTTRRRRLVSSAALGARSSQLSDPVQHKFPSCLRCTSPSTCPPSKADTFIV